MRRFLNFFVAILLAGGSFVTAADTLTIIHVNDSHSNLAPGGRRTAELKGTLGGIARAATYIGMAKATMPNVMVVHSGDLAIGDLFFNKYFGVAELQLMGALGFDALTLGNHEFDLTPAVLKQAYDAAFAQGQPFSIVSANLVLEDTAVQSLKNYIKENAVKEIGGIKVGIFGMATPETNLLSLPAPAVIDTNIVPIAMAQVAALRAEGCDVVIMLSHLGSAIDGLVATYVPGIDLIVGGHSHEFIAADPMASGTPIVQTGGFYHSIGKLQLEIDGENVKLLNSRVDMLDETVPQEPTVAALVDGMIAEIEEMYSMPMYSVAIAQATDDIEQLAKGLTENGNHDTPLGNLVCDAFRAWGATDISVEPGGSVAQNLFKGPLVPADAYRAISYGFNLKNGLGYRMARFSVLGAEMMAGLEFGLADLSHDEFLVQVGGMSYTYDPTKPPTQRLVDVRVGSEPIDPMKRYSVTANEFVVMFFSVLGITPQDIQVNEDTTEFMVLAGYLGAVQSVSPNIEGRVKAAGTSSVTETVSVQFDWFSTCSVRGRLDIDLPGQYDDRSVVELYNVGLQSVPIKAEILGSDSGVHVSVDTFALSSGIYIMKVCIGDRIHLGRILVTQ
jgi:5'-nucleotidase / UDP-sugar diphosphatase